MTNHSLDAMDPSTTVPVTIAAILALSRWFAMDEVAVSVSAGGVTRECRARVQPGMTAGDIAGMLDPPGTLPDAADLLITPAPAAGMPDLPRLRARRENGRVRFDGTDAGDAGLADLAARLLAAIGDQPGADLSGLAPAPLAPVEGAAPPPLRGLDAPLDSRCVDMATGRDITGADLERRVTAIAGLLLDHGAGPGVIVGVALPRGIDAVAAWVAILRTGAGFLHIDLDLPAEQRRRMIEDAAPALLLAAGPGGESGGPARTLVLPAGDVPPPPAAARPAAARQAGPDDPAYLIFTSGSTGRPKAVMIGHAALDHHSRAAAAAFGLSPADRVLSFAAMGFDVAVEEILPTLRAGATLVLRSDAMLDTLERFVDELHAHRITVLNIPTAFWRLLTGSLRHPSSRGLPPGLRLVIVGGERVPSDTLEEWRRVAPGVVWMNGYGPTETTATATVHVDRGAALDTDSVPIGAPLGAARLALLAPDGSAAPPGRPGEMWIGGAGVGLGYANRPDLTAERFRPLPGRADWGRWYRTGDRVRPTPGGDLVFLDRMDRQLKLSGYRIEPGGIEAVLTRLPGVREARIAVQHGALAVWVAGQVDAAEIRAVLGSELPRGVSPRVMVLPEMPRNERGKLDEAALRDMMAGAGDPGDSAPAMPADAAIGRIMGELLGQPPLGAGQSFFDQGGNSLMAIALSEELARLFGRQPTLPMIYNHPTPQALARIMQSDRALPGGTLPTDHLIAVQPEGCGIPLVGIHVLGVNGEFFRPLAAALEPDHPVWGVTTGPLTDETPTDIDGLADLYFRRIRHFRPDMPLALAGVSLGAFVAFELAARLRRAGREVAMVAIFDADGPAPARRSTLRERLARALSRLCRDPGAALRHYGERARSELALGAKVIRIRLDRLRGRKRDRHSLDEFIAANVVSVAAHRPALYPGRVVIFAAGDDLADVERVRRTALGWAGVAPDRRFVCVPGNHLGILGEPGVRVIAQVIAEELAAVSPGQSPAARACRG